MKISLLAAVSADGRIGRSRDHLADWTSAEDKRFFVAKTKEAGVVVMGRATYETIGRPLPNRLNIILTRSSEGRETIPGVLEYWSGSVRELISHLQERGFEQLVVGGGTSVYSLFLQEGLVTDMYLTIESVFFGSGIALVEGVGEQKIILQEVERIGPESVLLHYCVQK